jgi:hypothetical protein
MLEWLNLEGRYVNLGGMKTAEGLQRPWMGPYLLWLIPNPKPRKTKPIVSRYRIQPPKDGGQTTLYWNMGHGKHVNWHSGNEEDILLENYKAIGR